MVADVVGDALKHALDNSIEQRLVIRSVWVELTVGVEQISFKSLIDSSRGGVVHPPAVPDGELKGLSHFAAWSLAVVTLGTPGARRPAPSARRS